MVAGDVGHRGGASRVTDQLLVDLNPVGRASVAIWLDGDEFPDLGEKFQLDMAGRR